MNWLLEENVFPEPLRELKEAISDQGDKFTLVKYVPFEGGFVDEQHRVLDVQKFENEPTFFYGSLNLSRSIQQQTSIQPGAICSFDNFRCINYYPHFEKWLLNRDYLVLPVSEAIRNRESIFSEFGRSFNFEDGWNTRRGNDHRMVFAKPDSGDKSFKGKLLHYSEFNLQGFEHGFYFDDPHLLTMVSIPTLIENEYRFFVSGKKILSYSSYKVDGRDNTKEVVPQIVIDYVQNVLNEVQWCPDPIYVLDTDGCDVIELNSVSSSGLYQCDPKPIVRKIKELYDWRPK